MKYKQLTLGLDNSWVLEHRNDETLPIDRLDKKLRLLLPVEDSKDATLTGCTFLIKADDTSDKKIVETLHGLMLEFYDINSADTVFEYDLTDVTIEDVGAGDAEAAADDTTSEAKADSLEEQEPKTKSDSKKVKSKEAVKEFIGAESSQDTMPSAQERIANLIGASAFKALAEECAMVAPLVTQQEQRQTFLSRTYLLSINDGCGLTTCLELYSGLLDELQVMKAHKNNPIVEMKLLEEETKRSGGFQDARMAIAKHSKDGGRVLCFDVSELMSNSADVAFRELLRSIEDHPGDRVVFFRIPFVEYDVLQKVQEKISDILPVKSLPIPPFTSEELLECAQRKLVENNHSLSENAQDVFQEIIRQEKRDGRFYGINTVNKVVQEILLEKLFSSARKDSDAEVIEKDEIITLLRDSDDYTKNGFEMLDELIGMETVKARVREIVAQIEASLKNDKLDRPSIHMRFVGNPGTGKTTVARIVGKILKEKGILRNGAFFEYHGRDFCGEYVGQTAPKTASMCRDAYGSVMFIDEAYSLYRSDESPRDYGREALDTLIAEMENHRNDLVVIMAGYTDDMETLMQGNAGLESRMPHLLEFPNYTQEELATIFMLMAKGRFTYDAGLEGAVNSYFLSLGDDDIASKEFSNARFVRNLFERTWGKAVLRNQMDSEGELLLTAADFETAIANKEFQKIAGKKKLRLGFA